MINWRLKNQTWKTETLKLLKVPAIYCFLQFKVKFQHTFSPAEPSAINTCYTVLFSCPNKLWQWANMHSIRSCFIKRKHHTCNSCTRALQDSYIYLSAMCNWQLFMNKRQAPFAVWVSAVWWNRPQDPKTVTAKWNSAIINLIISTGAFPAVTCQNVLLEKGQFQAVFSDETWRSHIKLH